MLIKLATLTRALTKHITGGLKQTDEEQYSNRLKVCSACPFRSEGTWVCEKCGCHLSLKASWKSENCPLGMWAGDVRPKNSGCVGCGT